MTSGTGTNGALGQRKRAGTGLGRMARWAWWGVMSAPSADGLRHRRSSAAPQTAGLPRRLESPAPPSHTPRHPQAGAEARGPLDRVARRKRRCARPAAPGANPGAPYPHRSRSEPETDDRLRRRARCPVAGAAMQAASHDDRLPREATAGVAVTTRGPPLRCIAYARVHAASVSARPSTRGDRASAAALPRGQKLLHTSTDHRTGRPAAAKTPEGAPARPASNRGA
jgi:hypothetical protein